MKILNPSFTPLINQSPESFRELSYALIANAMTKCYRPEKPKHPNYYVSLAMKKNHLTVLEHVSVSAELLCDRGVSHELVRHRLASFTQESTRYCNYSSERFGMELTFILPSFLNKPLETFTPAEKNFYFSWKNTLEQIEQTYLHMLSNSHSPQLARAILPNSLSTRLVMTCNLREWLHILKLRTSPAAHPDMQYLMNLAKNWFVSTFPEIFNCLNEEN